jgi:hypothetical protein
MSRALVAAFVCSVGCGGGNGLATQGVEGAAQGGGDSSSGVPGTTAAGDTADRSFELRLQGMDVGDLESVLVRLKAVEVRANGTVLANTLMTPEMDLVNVAHGFLLTTFRAPAGVEEVDLSVAFDSARATRAKHVLDVDLGCEVVRVKAKVKLLEQRHHAVIFLDLARSLAKVGTGMGFAPRLQLVY